MSSAERPSVFPPSPSIRSTRSRQRNCTGKAIELAGLTGKERVIDAYCGIGTIGLIASDKAKEVISVELNSGCRAGRDRKCKTQRNQKCPFLSTTTPAYSCARWQKPENSADVVFMDPPRSGSDEKFLSSVITLHPKKIVYVSCDPTTLARDLKYLTKHGYKARRVIPVDMFPATEHCENCVLLERK